MITLVVGTNRPGSNTRKFALEVRPLEQLQQLFLYRGAHIYPERVYLPKIGKLLIAEGRMGQSELADRLRAQAAGFITFVQKLNPYPA